ncbi:Uncharacterised protein [Mycobacteroides abscessus]|nr:Uncharacterised protein [Mycobacteroides abscessus]
MAQRVRRELARDEDDALGRGLERAVRGQRGAGEHAVQALPQGGEVRQRAQRPGTDLDEAGRYRRVGEGHASSSAGPASSVSSNSSATPLSSSRSRTRRGTRSSTGAPEPAVAAW